MTDLERLRAFFTELMRGPLYELGLADSVSAVGGSKIDTREDALIATAFIMGAASTARLSWPFLSGKWRAFDGVASACGVALTKLRYPQAMIPPLERSIDQWEREIRADLQRHFETEAA